MKWSFLTKGINHHPAWRCSSLSVALPSLLAGAHYDGNHLTVHKLYKQGDHFHHHISVKDSGYKRDIDFQLGQENQIQHNGTTVTYKYTEDGDVLKSEIKGITNKAIHDTYTVKGDELEKVRKKLKTFECVAFYEKFFRGKVKQKYIKVSP